MEIMIGRGGEKTKPIRRALAGNPKNEARNPKQRQLSGMRFEKTKPIYERAK